MIEKTFDAKSIEGDIYQNWLNAKVFECDVESNKPTFSIMMPPPNVTGVLHIGHALNSTIQDVLVRFKRQCGFDVLWQPGTDHAGIATQFVVERQLKIEGISRLDLGREKFLERVWEWKEESGNKIFAQMQCLGISPDWKRARFTMDDGMSDAVLEVFVKLYNDGLIYKDKRLVNWDPVLQTAVSDLEVNNIETKGKLYHIAYVLADDPSQQIVIATTRPETLFGDTALAVHPEDERLAHLIGKKVKKPLTDHLIPVIGDEHVDKDFGTGGLKVTPAHDFNDFAIGKRHGLEFLNILNADGTLNNNVPPAFQGLSSEKAREAVVRALEEQELLLGTENITHAVPFSERTEVRIEPYLTDQWFVDTESMAKKALDAVTSGKTTFFPKNWENTYFEWLKNIQPWCISRQIWWGHQIPAWYGPDGHVFVEKTETNALSKAKNHYGKETILTRDSDVLDTWFSSALWPFSTLGWPTKTPELEKYYPTSVLVTGFDIIFFWVARMMMMGIHFQKAIPFEKIYMHALVRDEKGQKMSKTRGNVLDPLDLIEAYGADALRFTLTILAAPGRDIKIGPARVESYRNFLTKLWNAARFLQMQEGGQYSESFDPNTAKLTLSKWLVGHIKRLSQDVKDLLEEFRFDLAAQRLYHFVWGTYCDYFLEFIKPILSGEDQAARQEILDIAYWAYGQILILLQPITPFITEHLWTGVGGKDMLCTRSYPELEHLHTDKMSEDQIDHLMQLIMAVRKTRADFRVPPAVFLRMSATGNHLKDEMLQTLLKRMARLDNVMIVSDHTPQAGDISMSISGTPYYLHLGDAVDLEQEKKRLNDEISKLEKDLASWQARLGNQDFIAKAKEEIIDEMRERVDVATVEIAQKKESLKAL